MLKGTARALDLDQSAQAVLDAGCPDESVISSLLGRRGPPRLLAARSPTPGADLHPAAEWAPPRALRRFGRGQRQPGHGRGRQRSRSRQVKQGPVCRLTITARSSSWIASAYCSPAPRRDRPAARRPEYPSEFKCYRCGDNAPGARNAILVLSWLMRTMVRSGRTPFNANAMGPSIPA
jgi:hypothetical protein